MKTWCLTAIVAMCAPLAFGQVEIGTTGQAEGRIPIAVPDCCTAPGQEAIGKAMARVLAYDLYFSGVFGVVPPNAYPRTFTGFTRDPQTIDFEAWRSTPAEFLVHAYVTSDAQSLTAECRLFDVLSGEMVSGKRLATRGQEWHRLVAHQFADEIVRHLTGVAGCASSRICFSGGSTGKKEIYIADYDGANMKQVTQHGSISILPKFSPDGRKIAYLSYKDRYPFLYVLDLDTGESRPLSKQVGLNVAPAWSPDSRQLAIVQSKDGNSEIYLVNVDGSNPRRITNDSALDTSPAFDPSGTRIAFVSERGGAAQIFVMAADGSGVKRISYQGGRAYDPVWSPDGSKIAYVVDKSGDGFEIYVMNADGAGAKRMTNSAGNNESPTWSPDSRHVMFASSRSGRWELGAVNVESGEEQRIAIDAELSLQGPSWGPRRQ
ncbi:MAG TPA: Tol-Pal system beta propeller repeat protein TolB [Candidatus Hydrogenedentes bacterium]|nr:Tol-Pal system beta propeller repeat protein TolB [FCB group bacterium]NLT60937.1 Tol-Pal system beta propeller repeat protein TolB [Candidatus Hydrogenedentota bacterium]HNZ20000.1 Tol-Pal system beta propeller repeat protein TolB [Candidatus Hydrogenedentota bacterium]HPA06393.1 Tol-Pal system beta propeller repeat protein TolB [Candidatus Hydrogenedentota bacterium]HQM33901.1 Tol-Pal system beta propeller repeat protein TolB [Candidatus Hydrogenedentota bacterium]